MLKNKSVTVIMVDVRIEWLQAFHFEQLHKKNRMYQTDLK